MKPSTLWIFVICAFAILIIAWGALIVIASKNKQETIPVETNRPAKN